MKDVFDELTAAHRTLGKGSLPAGDAYTIEVRRRYDAHVDDVWDAITSPERLGRWLHPVTGDLRPGGRFDLDSGEHGEILGCEPPRLLKVTWLYGPEADAWPGTSEVEVRLAPGPTGDTEFELIHARRPRGAPLPDLRSRRRRRGVGPAPARPGPTAGRPHAR